ncbi:Rab-GTPase-TBC domain containing protein [Novymonas esmeraldas]|uniref:Rab-GTPase-TBC domain containing protein n=1 Tax=Novymonas esmeraldas TaxID=1808958 RepID=A0AAW0F329_9TRYP
MSRSSHPARGGSPVVSVDAYGFLLTRPGSPTPTERHGADRTAGHRIDEPLTSSTWTTAALAEEEEWWVASFAMLLSWRATSAAPPTPSSTAAVDAALVERWFHSRWLRRLRCHGGCPHASLRRLLWGFFGGAWQRCAAAQAALAGHYTTVTTAMTAASADPDAPLPVGRAVLESIDRDVGRTFPSHVLFRGPLACAPGQQQLRRLLAAYAALDPEVGYCQGMAFVAAVTLLVAPEPDAFHLFCGLMRDGAAVDVDVDVAGCVRGCEPGLRRLYLAGFPLLQVLLHELERHVSASLPALAAHFVATEVDVAMFASQWFLTLYAHQLPPAVLLRVWDVFLVRGWPVMIQVAVALLHQEQETLLGSSLDGVLLHLQSTRSRLDGEEDLLRRIWGVPSV